MFIYERLYSYDNVFFFDEENENVNRRRRCAEELAGENVNPHVRPYVHRVNNIAGRPCIYAGMAYITESKLILPNRTESK